MFCTSDYRLEIGFFQQQLIIEIDFRTIISGQELLPATILRCSCCPPSGPLSRSLKSRRIDELVVLQVELWPALSGEAGLIPAFIFSFRIKEIRSNFRRSELSSKETLKTRGGFASGTTWFAFVPPPHQPWFGNPFISHIILDVGNFISLCCLSPFYHV